MRVINRFASAYRRVTVSRITTAQLASGEEETRFGAWGF
jgi:hypothetical protein